jgi:FRG domain
VPPPLSTGCSGATPGKPESPPNQALHRTLDSAAELGRSAANRRLEIAMALDWYTTLTISSWDDFQREYESRFALRGRRWVFRGQQDTRWDLKPSLERSACDRVGLSLTELPEIEAYLLTRFQRNLHRFQARVPASEDHLEWLALMQHHGAPTRLLDWTYSCYIALFFALELAPLDTTCAVWAIDQVWLFLRLRELSAEGVREAFKLDPELRSPRSAHTLLTTKGVTSVAPLVPYHLSERLAVQQGVFLVPLNLEVSFMLHFGHLRRQEDGISLTRDELSPKFMLSKEVSHATPARSDHTGVGSLCATVFAARLAPCPSLARGRDARAHEPAR